MASYLGYMTSDQKDKKKDLIDTWIRHLDNWFPHLNEKTYFVPPLHVNIIALAPHQRGTDSKDITYDGKDNKGVFEQNQTLTSDERDNRAQLSTIHSLWHLANNRQPPEKMVVLTRYGVGNYLDKTLTGESRSKKRKITRTAANVPSLLFPVPRESEDLSIRRGDFDILIIHHEFGFIVIEVKTLGDREGDPNFMTVLENKLSQAVKQLNRLERTLRYIVNDVKDVKIPVTKALALPHIDREKLSAALHNTSNVELQKVFQECFGAREIDNALSACFCSDEVIDMNILGQQPNDAKLSGWWEHLLQTVTKTDSLSEDLYKELVARFCGPISTVAVWSPWRRRKSICEVRTAGEAAHEMEVRYTMRVLREEQISLLRNKERLMFITGPPRAGKTLTLLLKAVEWATHGDAVVVVRGPGNNPGNFVSLVLYHQIVNMLDSDLSRKNVRLSTINALWDPESFVQSSVSENRSNDRQTLFLIDEIWVVDLSDKLSSLVPAVCKSLKEATRVIAEPLVTSHNAQRSRDTSDSKVWDMTKQINDALNDTERTMDSYQNTDVWATTLMEKDDVKHFLQEMKGEVNRLKLKIRDLEGSISEPGTLQKILETVQDTKFYAETLLSWLASGILKGIAETVARQEDDVSLWCTGFWPRMRPDQYRMTKLTTSIGCPPHVQRIMKQTEKLASHLNDMQYSYVTKSTDINPPLPVEGEFCYLLNHGVHMKGQKETTEVSECQSCAHELVTLFDSLGVEKNDSALHYRDILIIGRALLPMKEDSTFIKELHLPTQIIRDGVPDPVMEQDLTTSNVVTVTNTYHGHGLERAIVVFVPVIGQCEEFQGEGQMGRRDGEVTALSAETLAEPRLSGDGVSTVHTTSCAECLEKEEWMRKLGKYNQRGLWFVASRSAADLIIIHV